MFSTTVAASTIAPTAGLCSAGTSTAVTSGTNTFTWGCNGANGGTSTAANACSSVQQYTVTTNAPGAGSGGTLSCGSPVNGGSTTTCTATPDTRYSTGSISGCGGAATVQGITAYTTGAVSASCTVTASFSLSQTPGATAPTGGTPARGASGAFPATASAGQPITHTSNTPSVCTVTSARVYYVGTGTCTIRATAPGNGTTAALDTTLSFAVGDAAATQVPTLNAWMLALLALTTAGFAASSLRRARR